MKIFFSAWIIGGVCLYYFGPIHWPGAQSPAVAFFVLGCLAAFLFGANTKGQGSPDRERNSWIPRSRTNALILMALHAITTLVYVYLVTGRSAISGGSYSNDFGAVYQSYQDFSQNLRFGIAGKLIYLLNAGLFPVVLAVFVERFRDRWVVALFVTPLVISSLLRGTDKEIVDIFVLCAAAAALHGLLTWWRVLLGVGLGIGGVALFVVRRLGRFGGSLPACLPDSESCFNYGGFIARSFGQSAEVTNIFLVHYLTNGYQGLSLAFSLPWSPNWGLGHLPPIQSSVCSLVRIGCSTNNYQNELTASGWNSSAHWTSVYPILANDLSFYLVPIFMIFLGIVFRRSMDMWRSCKDPAAGASVLIVAMFLIYSSVNMQIAISLDWALASVVFLYFTPWRRKQASDIGSEQEIQPARRSGQLYPAHS